MNCPDCGRPMDESMDKKLQYFTCPRCGEIYSLTKFKQKAGEEVKRIAEEEKAEKVKTKEDTQGGNNYNQRHDTRVLDEVQRSTDAIAKKGGLI